MDRRHGPVRTTHHDVPTLAQNETLQFRAVLLDKVLHVHFFGLTRVARKCEAQALDDTKMFVLLELVAVDDLCVERRFHEK